MKRATLTAVIVAALSLGTITAAAAPPTVRELRHAIAWNHSVVVDMNARLAVANGRAGGSRTLPACHSPRACTIQLRQQQHARRFALGAYRHLLADNSRAGAQRVVRYRFHPCGAIAVTHAFDVVEHESGWDRDSVNSAGDTSWWQFELPAHPDISVAEARDIDWSTKRAVRDSDCGRNFSPEWTAATRLGIP